MLFIFVVGLVLLWAKEDKLKENVKKNIEHPKMELIFDNIRAVQDFVFVEDGYCNNKVKRLQDCEMDELDSMILSGNP